MASVYTFVLTSSRIADDQRVPEAADDTDVTDYPQSDNFIYAFQIDAEKGPFNRAFKVQWRNITDEGTFADLAATGEMAWGTDTVLVDDQAHGEAYKICTHVPSGSTFWQEVDNEGDNTLPDSGTWYSPDEYYSEPQWAIDPAGADIGDNYEFRIWDTTENVLIGVAVAKITFAAGGVAKYATLADTVGITDSISRSKGIIELLTESIGITDVITNARQIVKSILDTEGITDTRTTKRNIKKSIFDSVGIADSLTRSAGRFSSIADAIGITDVLTAVIGGQNFFRTIQDTVGITDTLTTARTILKILSDNVGITDVLIGIRTSYRTFAESIGITDTIITKRNIKKSILDSVGITDTLVTARLILKTISDPVGITDTLSAAVKIVASLSDSVGITDVIITTRHLVRLLADTVAITEKEGFEEEGIALLDGENAGTTPWEFDAIYQDSSAIFSLQAIAKHKGDYGYRTFFSGIPTMCYGQKGFTEEGELYYRFYIYTQDIFNWATNNYQTHWLIDGYDGAVELFRFGFDVDVNKSPYRWRLMVGGGNRTWTEAMRGKWVFVEIHWKAGSGSDGGAGFYIDGTYRNGKFDLDHSSYKIDTLKIGWTGATLGNPSNNSWLYYDDMKIDTQYIGEYDAFRGPTTSRDIVKSILDSVGIADDLSASKGAIRSVSDSVGITDLLSAAKFVLAFLTDTVGIVDTIIVIRSIVRSVADSVGITDVIIVARSMKRLIADTVGISSMLVATKFVFASLADTVGITDTIVVIRSIVKLIADAVGIGDTIAVSRNIVKLLSDTVGMTDVLSRSVEFVRNISDTVGVTSVISHNAGRIAKLFDGLGIFDVIIVKLKKRIIDSFGKSRIAKVLGISKSRIDRVSRIEKPDIVKSDGPDGPDIVGK